MVRFLIAVVLGALVAFGLFFMMQALIATGQRALTEDKSTRIVDFVRVKREERLESKRSKPDRPHESRRGSAGGAAAVDGQCGSGQWRRPDGTGEA